MGNSTAGLLTDGVTISQVYANNGLATDQRYGYNLDLDNDGSRNDSDEFIAISNFSTTAVDISGWQLWRSVDGAGSLGQVYHTFPPGTMLAAGASLYVVTEYAGTPPAGVVEANGNGTQSFANGTNLLFDGAGGEFALVNRSDPANVEYVQFTMDATPDNVTTYSGFPKNSDGSTATRVMGDPLPPNTSPDVLPGYIMGAQRIFTMVETPDNGMSVTYDPIKGEVGYINGAAIFPGGTTNQAGINLNGIAFYEVLPDNNAGTFGNYDIDGDGTATGADQFVSFKNVTGSPIDISGYEIWSTTQLGDDTVVFKYHTFAPGTILQPNEVIYVVTEYTGDPSLRDQRIVESNAVLTTNTSELLRANSDGEIALVEPASGGTRDYVQFTFDLTPANLNTQGPFPGDNRVGLISASGQYLDGTNPTNSDTYRYNHTTGIVTEIPQFVALAVCFAGGTKIKTREGEIPVELLKAGSEVLTLDNGYKTVRWIGSRHLSKAELERNPKLRPIRISAGAFGPDQDFEDLIVSPQHRILIRSQAAQRMFGEQEVLVPAKSLLSVHGVQTALDLDEVTYWHFMFDDHEIVFSNGIATESLFTGPQALKAVSPSARAEILSLFPGMEREQIESRRPARQLVRGRKAHVMIEKSSDLQSTTMEEHRLKSRKSSNYFSQPGKEPQTRRDSQPEVECL